MGTTRAYIQPRLPSREENEENRKVHGLSLITNKRGDVQKQAVKDRTKQRKKDRELIDGRLVSINCPKHGSYSSYIHWFCRCEPCVNAYNRRRNEQRYGVKAI